jgi:hypothetical protein
MPYNRVKFVLPAAGRIPSGCGTILIFEAESSEEPSFRRNWDKAKNIPSLLNLGRLAPARFQTERVSLPGDSETTRHKVGWHLRASLTPRELTELNLNTSSLKFMLSSAACPKSGSKQSGGLIFRTPKHIMLFQLL